MSERYIEGNRDIGSRDSMGLYLEEIGKTPLLTAEEEVELAQRIEAGLLAEKIVAGEVNAETDATPQELDWIIEQGKAAKQLFIESNLRLTVSLARKYRSAPLPLGDLVQEGNQGLIRGVEKFDYQKGYKFSTYGTWWIRQALTRAIADKGRTIRLPVHITEEVNKVTSARRLLESTLEREVTIEEVASEVGMDVTRVRSLLDWGRDTLSLDAPVSADGEVTLGDIWTDESMPGVEDEVIHHKNIEDLEALLYTLDDRSATIVRLRYGLVDGRAHSLRDIGKHFGISAERTRQLERQAINNLKTLAQADNGA